MSLAFTSGEQLDPFLAPTTSPVTSLVGSEFIVPAACEPCRIESQFKVKINGKYYIFTLRDKIIPEDPFLVALKAAAYSISHTEQYRGVPPPRNVRDFLIKQNVGVI